MKRAGKQEIEIKLRVKDAAEMRRRLRGMGGRVVRRVHEINTVLDTSWGTLRKHGRVLRLRVETPYAGRGAQRFVLTLKGPPGRDLRYKVREETETVLLDPQGLLAIFEALGLQRAFRYEKFRTSYRVRGAGGVHVEFDETPAGAFLELEGSRRSIDRMARRLGYGPGDYITRSYAALHFEECRRRGVRAGDMVFESKKNC